MSLEYDSDELLERIAGWVSAETTVRRNGVNVEQVIPERSRAQLAFKASWNPPEQRSSRRLDVTSLAKSLNDKFGPLVVLKNCNLDGRFVEIEVLPVPRAVADRLAATIRSATSAIKTDSERSLKIYIVLFIFALAMMLDSVVRLHNHWYDREEPWETTLEFIQYHLLHYVGGAAKFDHGRGAAKS